MPRRRVQRNTPPNKVPPSKNTGAYYVDQEMARRFAQGQGEAGVVPLTYDPTKTTWPENGWDHRRTTRAGYDRSEQTLRIQFFTNGAIYNYYDVPPEVARAFYRADSPGRFINAVLNGYEYERIE
jgi:hypothetical protein